MPQPPALTPAQRLAALQKAAKVRHERAEVKAKLKGGSITLSDLLGQAENDETLAKMKVLSVLESLPGLGKVRAVVMMDSLGIDESRRLRGLGANQRKSLLDQAGTASRGGVRMQTSIKAILRRDLRKMYPSAPLESVKQVSDVAVDAMNEVLRSGSANSDVALQAGKQIRETMLAQGQEPQRLHRALHAR